jgi:hypothetical protein
MNAPEMDLYRYLSVGRRRTRFTRAGPLILKWMFVAWFVFGAAYLASAAVNLHRSGDCYVSPPAFAPIHNGLPRRRMA